MSEPKSQKSTAFRAGIIILVILAVLTAAEYGLSLSGQSAAFIFLGIGLVKAFFVVRDYMHLGKLFSGGEEHE